MNRTVVGAVTLVVLASAAYGAFSRHRVSEWETRADSALRVAAAQQERAFAHRERAEAAENAARRLRIQADSLRTRTRERIVEVREIPVPEECEEVVAPRDSIIDTLEVESETLRDALDAQMEAAAQLRVEADTWRERGDSLEVVLQDRPGPRARWVPVAGVGLFAGMCSNGLPCMGAGVTLTWEIF